MLNLSKGELQGTVQKTCTSGGLIVASVEYNDQSKSFYHSHENPHLNFVLQGEMAVGRKSHLGIDTNIENFAYVPTGLIHQTFLVSSFCRSIDIELKSFFFDRYSLKESDLNYIPGNAGSSTLMLEVYRELQFIDNSFGDNVDILVLKMLRPLSHPTRKSVPKWVNLIRDLLCDNWNKEVSLQEVAHVVSIHPVTISKYFNQYFGCNLGDYRRRLKIERALQFMKNSSLSLTEISYTCGFCDQSHFIRAFKNITGFSPGKFFSK